MKLSQKQKSFLKKYVQQGNFDEIKKKQQIHQQKTFAPYKEDEFFVLYFIFFLSIFIIRTTYSVKSMILSSSKRKYEQVSTPFVRGFNIFQYMKNNKMLICESSRISKKI
jgi:hypothetical protein